MSAIVKACKASSLIQNTGVECHAAMGPTAMIIALPKSVTFTLDDLADPSSWISTLIHAAKASRGYPLFGNVAPIRTITNNKEADVLVTLDDGSTKFVRYGFFNRMFNTTEGGICFAQKLMTLNNSGYSTIEVDAEGQLLVRNNGNGTYSGLRTSFMYAGSPDLADLRNPYKNNFMLSISPVEYMKYGEILAGGIELLDAQGLIDAEITSEAAGTTTKLTIGVKTSCADTDLVALLGAPLAEVDNFIVTNKATGAVITPSAAAIVSGKIELTGVYAAGQTFVVSGAAASVWKGNTIEGYEATTSVEIAIPA